MRRPNQYSENPHPAGTFLAAQWDLNRALSDLVRESRKTAARDAKNLHEFFRSVTRSRKP